MTTVTRTLANGTGGVRCRRRRLSREVRYLVFRSLTARCLFAFLAVDLLFSGMVAFAYAQLMEIHTNLGKVLVLLAVLVAVFVRFGPLGVLRAGFPPVEELSIERITLPAPQKLTIAGSGNMTADKLAPDAQVSIAGSGRPEVAAVSPLHGAVPKLQKFIVSGTFKSGLFEYDSKFVYASLAAMQALPADLYEAAEIDGAPRARQFWQITVPLLRPTVIFTVIISTIYGLQLFTEPLMFTSGSGALGGGSLGQFQTVTMFVVEAMRAHQRWGYAATAGLVLLVLILVVAAINFALVRRLGSER